VTSSDPGRLAEQAATRIAEVTGVPRHHVVVVLGSGWAPAAAGLGDPVAELAMTQVPGFVARRPRDTAARSRRTTWTASPFWCWPGAPTCTRGLGLRPVVHGIRTARRHGCSRALLTNANGSLRDDLEVGQAVLIRDHLNLTGTSPIEGAHFRRPDRLLVEPVARPGT
jgi:purine-nucleoside phosphorylase